MTRRSFKPTDEQRRLVEACAGFGVPEDQIRLVVTKEDGKPIARNTLRKYFKRELESGHTRTNIQVAKSLYQQAINGHVGACIFWMKTRAGWREKTADDEAMERDQDGQVFDDPDPDV